MSELADFLSEIPSPRKNKRELEEPVKNNLMCRHEIIAEWCAECKRLDTPSIKQVLLQENLEIVENILSWETKRNRIS